MSSPKEALWNLAFLLEGSWILEGGGCAHSCLEEAGWGGNDTARRGGGARALGEDWSSLVIVGPERVSHLSKITQKFGARPRL